MVNMVGVKTTLNNNCSLRVDPDAEVVYVNVPKLEGDNVYFNTNSSFSKIEKIIDYKWPKTRNINWLTVHQTKPFIAYVLLPDFQDSNRLSRSVEELDPQKQIVRIMNYHNQKRVLLKPSFSTSIADLGFAYVTMSNRKDDKLAVVDRFANVIIYSFSEDNSGAYKAYELLKIVSEVGVPFSEVRLAWCPGYVVDEEDFGMNLAISYDNTIEVYDVGRFIERGFCHISKEELELSTPERKLIKETGCEPIITVALSNDLAMICSASKDNRVRFYQFEDEEVRLVHTWEPKWLADGHLSCIFFLDDFNELLKDQDCGIWGYIFVGTSTGEITIWESNLWRPIQKVVLSFPDDEPSNITYRIDLTSHVIIAIQEKTGFLLHLEFLDGGNCGVDDGDKSLLVKQPRIKKITRFQLYNPILSFTIKRPNPSQIEIFWLTQKTIEKCLVDVDSLVIDENSENTFLNRYNISNISQEYDSKRSSLLFQNMSINGADDESVGNDSSRRSLSSYEQTPPVTLAEIFNNTSTISESGASGLAVGGSGNEAKSISGGHPMMSDPMSQRPTSSPTSREVANYLDDEKVHSRKPNLKVYEDMLRMDPQGELNVPSSNKILNIEPRVQYKMIPHEPLPKDLVKEEMLKVLESNLTDHLESIKSDIECLRNEVKDPSQLKAFNKIGDVLIKKLMHQMNGTVAKGLEEFMVQIGSTITTLVNNINQCRNDFNSHFSSVEKQFKQLEAQIPSVEKQFKQCEAQITELRKEVSESRKNQAEILTQLRLFQHQHAVSPSPTSLRHHLMNVTPTPNQQTFSPLINPQSEEERRIRAEQERVARLAQMWKKIRSNDKGQMIEGISQALNLKDPVLINQICEHFRATKGAPFMVELILHDQTLLLSLLSALAQADLRREPWKIPFITSIVRKLDGKSSYINDCLPQIETKLLTRLEEANNLLEDQDRDIPWILMRLIRNR